MHDAWCHNIAKHAWHGECVASTFVGPTRKLQNVCRDAGNKSGVWSKVKITVDIDTIVAAVSQAVQDGHYIQFNLVLDADVKLP